MGLIDLPIKDEYRIPENNIVNEFYIPLLNESVLYKRSVAYFTSSSLIEISYGITSLIKNGGNIQLIVSPVLSKEDIEAINKGYDARESVTEQALLKYLEKPANYFEKERLNLLANLIAMKKLDIKVAYSVNRAHKLGLYHEKLGLFYDHLNHIVAFSGSMNESDNAFSNNYETVDVFTSWNDRKRVLRKVDRFEKLWNNLDESAVVFDFPETVKRKMMSYRKGSINFNIDLEELKMNQKIEKIPKISVDLYKYQLEAINNWKQQNYVGIFDMATGTGKTYTALGAIKQIYHDLKGKVAVFIVCPLQHHVNQWVEDIVACNIDVIIGHSASIQKDFQSKLKAAVFDYNLGVKNFFCFICTNQTFAKKYIQEQINKIKGDILLIIDEAHNFGSLRLKRTLDDRFKYRLALSATFERHHDLTGTRDLYHFFKNKCIEFSLEDAIKGKFLTPYKYYPVVVSLTQEELEEYHTLSKKIARNIHTKNGKSTLNEYGKLLALKRSRIISGASQKIQVLIEKMKKYKHEKNILVYCGTATVDQVNDDKQDIRQIDAISKVLGNQLGMKVAQFTSRENSYTRELLKRKYAEGENLQALIAIKCLDEGVNIPSIKTVFILASTTNPKEYIQRRGRVLRKFPNKEYAEIYDFITLPRNLNDVVNMSNEEIRYEKGLVRNELNRMMEFKRIAMNSMESDILIEQIKDAYHLLEIDDVFIELEDGSYE